MEDRGVVHELKMEALLSEPVRTRGEQAFRQLLKENVFNCLVISDDTFSYSYLKRIADSIRETYVLESECSIQSLDLDRQNSSDGSVVSTATMEDVDAIIQSLAGSSDLTEEDFTPPLPPPPPPLPLPLLPRESAQRIKSVVSIRDMIDAIRRRLECNSYSVNIDFSDIFSAGLKYVFEVINDNQVASFDIDSNAIKRDFILDFSQHLLKNDFSYVGKFLKDTQISPPQDCNDPSSSVQLTENGHSSSNDKAGSDVEIQPPVAKDTLKICLDLHHLQSCYSILSSCLKHSQISSIDLHNYTLNHGCIIFLSCLLKNSNISSIDVSKIDMDSASLKVFASALTETKITSLNLSDNKIQLDGFVFLSSILKSSRIVSIDLSLNKIDLDCVRYLAEALPFTQISSINLANNEISFDGLKYLAQSLKGSKIQNLNLSFNHFQYESIEYLAEYLENTEVREIGILGCEITRDQAFQLCESIGRHSNTNVFIDFKDHVFLNHINLFRYPEGYIEINQPAIDKKTAKLINDAYKNVGIMKLVFDKFFSPLSLLAEAFTDLKISEIELIKTLLNSNFVTIFEKCTIGEWNGHCALGVCERETPPHEETADWGTYHSYPLKCVPKKNVMSVHLQKMSTDHFLCLKVALENSNITYLNLSNNEFQLQFDYEMKCLVRALKNSQIISLNISNNGIGGDVMELLAEVLPETKLFYIDLNGNKIGDLGFRYIMGVVNETNLCWLSLEDNDIELPEGTELSPYIVPRKNTPIEFQMRYLFNVLVSMNTDSNEYEFTIPKDDSHLFVTLNHYPQLMKMLLDIPNSKIHVYDTMYMINKRHNIHIMTKIETFIKNIEKRFSSFFECESPNLEQLYGYDSFLDLVIECDTLAFNDMVKYLLLHRVLFYVDENNEILHPFIYKMLHKHSMTLFNEDIEPNKKQRILDYFYKHPEIDYVQEGIDLLLTLEPSSKMLKLN